MQIRSFRESGEPVWVNAPASAPVRLGPDSRSALGPAATPAALTGRTRDRTRPMLHQVRKLLPERRPHVTRSRHGPIWVAAFAFDLAYHLRLTGIACSWPPGGLG